VLISFKISNDLGAEPTLITHLAAETIEKSPTELLNLLQQVDKSETVSEHSTQEEVTSNISNNQSEAIDSPQSAVRTSPKTMDSDCKEQHNSEDVEMADISAENRRGTDKKGKNMHLPKRIDRYTVRTKEQTLREASRNMAVRRTELATATDPKKVLSKILSMKVELTMGEILSNSQELTQALAVQIRFRYVTSSKSMLQAHHICVSHVHGPLLTVPVRIENQVYKAIVDSGSEVNIITWELWEKLQVLMDVDASLMLCDANGGNGELKGLIPNLAIQIGGLTTHSNFWVSTECPLDILLSRPWQCHNLVSINERLDGTYLRFSHVNRKDNQTLEILVQPQEAKNGSAPLISGRCNATTHSYLGIVVEPEIQDEMEMEVCLEHEAQGDNMLPPKSVFNTVCTAGEILGGNMPKGSYQLKDAYLSLFQPDPTLQGYGLPAQTR